VKESPSIFPSFLLRLTAAIVIGVILGGAAGLAAIGGLIWWAVR
jgi:hypothetical protein